MRKMIKFVSMLLTLSLCLGIFAPAFAAEQSTDIPTTFQIQEPSNSTAQLEATAFFNYMALIFENPDEYRAINKSGNDITEDFCSSHLALYQNRDFHLLKAASDTEIAWIENVIHVNSNEDSVDLIEPYAANTEELRYITNLFPCISNLSLNFEFAIEMLGGYYYDTAKGKITQGDYPTIDVTYYSAGIHGNLTISNLVRNYYIIDSGKKIQFTASFSVYRTVDEWEPMYGGTYKLQMTGDKNGGEPVEYSPEGYVYPIG